ncbi:MAG: type II toxin-antitoxin system HicB family antitoxin [Salinivirgaceae bacterium]
MKTMEKIIVEVYYSGNNYSAYIPLLPGCITVGDTIEEIEKNMKVAVPFHLEGQSESGGMIPEVFKDEYELVFKLSAEALLNAYSNIFTKAALSRITGINERQLWHYAAGVSKPRPAQLKRIEDGIHKIGRQLIAVSL